MQAKWVGLSAPQQKGLTAPAVAFFAEIIWDCLWQLYNNYTLCQCQCHHPTLAGSRTVSTQYQLVSTSINSISSWLSLPSDKKSLRQVTLQEKWLFGSRPHHKGAISKRKTLLNLRNENSTCETLRKLYLRNLAKHVFAKPCESCETNVKLRRKHLRNLACAKLVFAKLAKHELRNNAKQCKFPLQNTNCEICENCENWVALRNYDAKPLNIVNNNFTTALLRVARPR